MKNGQNDKKEEWNTTSDRRGKKRRIRSNRNNKAARVIITKEK